MRIEHCSKRANVSARIALSAQLNIRKKFRDDSVQQDSIAERLIDAAKAASDVSNSLSSDLQDALDQAAGNQEAVENRRFRKQLADLKAAADAAGQLSSAQYAEDVANADCLHDLNMRNIQAQADAQKQVSASRSSSDSSGTLSSARVPSQPASTSSSGSSRAAAVAPVVAGATYNITLAPAMLTNDPQALANFAVAIKKQLDKIAAYSK